MDSKGENNMSDKNDLETPIPYGKNLVIKERNLEQLEKDVEEKFQSFIEDGEGNEATVGFEDPESIREILTPKRRELMKVIIEEDPESISKLAELTDRGVSQVHRSLKPLEENRIVYFEQEGEGKPKKPVIPYKDIEIRYNLKNNLMQGKSRGKA